MKCFICYRLKAERRVSVVDDAELVVAGYSTCGAHAHLLVQVNALDALELAREELRVWWKAAEERHGVFDSRSQKFADGTTFEDAE